MLVTTLTKKMAEDLTDYLLELGVRVRYLHSNVDTIQRIEILRDLRLGEFDVLVGINLLREGLDLPEVSLVAILDADKEGFLRSETSLIQMIGRAARNVDGQVIMYADKVTDSMQRAISETNRRRGLQQAYNAEHGIDPQTIRKAVTDILAHLRPDGDGTAPVPGRDRRGRLQRPATSGAATSWPTCRRRARPAHPDARGGDARGRGRAPLRVRRPPARRDQRPEARAARRGLSERHGLCAAAAVACAPPLAGGTHAGAARRCLLLVLHAARLAPRASSSADEGAALAQAVPARGWRRVDDAELVPRRRSRRATPFRSRCRRDQETSSRRSRSIRCTR